MKFLSFSKLLKTTLISSLILFSSSIFAEKLYIYNWTEYIPNSLLQKFTKETGIEVVYSTFESNEEMYSKMKLTNGGGMILFSRLVITLEKWLKRGC